MLSSAHVHAVNSSTSLVRHVLARTAWTPPPPLCCCSQASSNWSARCVHNVNAGPSSQTSRYRQPPRRRVAIPQIPLHRTFSSTRATRVQYQRPPAEYWEQRFLPESVTQLSSSNRDPFHLFNVTDDSQDLSPPLHPLEEALEKRGPTAAWAVFQDMTSTPQGCAEIPLHLADRLWWSIAAHAKSRPQPTNTHLEDELQRLAQIWKFVNDITGDSYTQPPFMDTLKSHRWLYLLVHRILLSRTNYRLGSTNAGPAYLNYLQGDLHRHLLDILQHMRRHGMLIHENVLQRLVEGMALSGRAVEGIYLWDDQQQSRLKSRIEGTAPVEDNAAAPATLLETVVETWLACLADEGPWSASRAQNSPADPPTILFWALKVITMAMDASLTLSKRPLTRCISGLNDATLLFMLPGSVRRTMRGQERRYAWLASIGKKNRTDVGSTADFSEVLRHLTQEHRDVLAEIIAFQLARRGDVRPAIAMHRIDSVSRGSQYPLQSDTRNALLRGFHVNVQAAIQAGEQREIINDAVHSALEIYHSIRKSSTLSQQDRRHATANIVDIMSVVVLPEAQTRQGDSAATSPPAVESEWFQPLRRVTSSILAADPQLNTQAIAAPTLSQLFKLHATLRDYAFTKDLWVKWQRHEVQKEFDSANVTGAPSWKSPGYLPMYGPHLAWFLHETLDRQGNAHVRFAMQIYSDWQASLQSKQKQHEGDAPQTYLPSAICAKLLRRLASAGMTHDLRKIINDMLHLNVDVTLQICKALSAAFKNPDAFTAEQTVEIVNGLVKLFRTQQEQAEGGGVKQDQPNTKHRLPLEMFIQPMMQVTSSTFTGWSEEWFAKILNLFQQFAAELESQLAFRASRPFNEPRLALITTSTVRAAFNSAIKALLEWPTIAVSGAVLNEMPSRRGAKSADVALDHLLQHAKDNSDLARSPQDGDAKRSAILHLNGILNKRLDMKGDWETWSLLLFAWMLPSATVPWEERKREALKIWQQSYKATFDANRLTEVKPWARFEVGDLHGRSFGAGKQQMKFFHGSTSTSTQSSEPTTDSANSATALMRPILLRPSTAARFILNLSLNEDEDTANFIYNSYLRQADELLSLYQSSTSTASTTSKPTLSSLRIQSEFRSLFWENLSVRRDNNSSTTPQFTEVLTDAVRTVKLARAVDLIWRLNGQWKYGTDTLSEARTCWIESAHASVPISRRLEDVDRAWVRFRVRVEKLRPDAEDREVIRDELDEIADERGERQGEENRNVDCREVVERVEEERIEEGTEEGTEKKTEESQAGDPRTQESRTDDSRTADARTEESDAGTKDGAESKG